MEGPQEQLLYGFDQGSRLEGCSLTYQCYRARVLLPTHCFYHGASAQRPLQAFSSRSRAPNNNSPDPRNEESMLGLPDGSACRLIALGDRILFPTMGSAPANWWPTAQSDQVRQKPRRRFQSEHFLLPSIISVLFALMAEMYTAASAANSVGGPKEGRCRVRLVHHGT